MTAKLTELSENFEAILCFDANLPKLKICQENCADKEDFLCVHRFKARVKVEHCNTKKFEGWSDLIIFEYFLLKVLHDISSGSVASSRCAFIILTKDRNFIDDIRNEWEEGDRKIDLVFSDSSISYGDVTVYIQQINTISHRHTKTSDLRCVFENVNIFLHK